MTLIDELKQAEFMKIQCDLRFSESIVVDLPTLLRLRRGIRSAGQYALPVAKGNLAMPNRFARLLEPPQTSDPVARRQHQKIGPAFVLQHNSSCLGEFNRGDILTLETILWGGNAEVVHDFILVLQALGRTGLRYDAGRFDLVAVRGEDSAQHWQMLWKPDSPAGSFMAPLRDCAWWLESYAPDCAEIKIEFTSPARLLIHGKPLFRAEFSQLFPFILRRVTSILYGHCQLDLQFEARDLIDVAGQVDVVNNSLRWYDWRELHSTERQQPIGGVSGEIVISDTNLGDLLPYIYLGSMMNVGKNAAYGAGCYTVTPSPV